MKLKQLVTVLGIIILITSMGLGAYFAYSSGLLTTGNNPAIQPKNIKITNINHDRFSISWVTDEQTNGSIIFGKSTKLDQLQIDDNDQLSGQQVARQVHHITLTSLDPETTYQFKIRSGEKNTIFDDNGKPFISKTASVLSTQPPADLVNGTVKVNGKPASDAIVYVTLPGMTQLSTQVKKDGTWLLNLAVARDSALTEYAKYDLENTSYDIFIQGDIKNSRVLLTTANDSPVPDIVLGETYDFTKNIAQATPLPSATPVATPESTNSARLAGQFPLEPDGEASESAEIPEQNVVEGFVIMNPYKDGEELSTQTPEFLGTGSVGSVLTLVISGTDNINTSTTVGSSGQWKYTPTKALRPGPYTMELSYINDMGETVNMERTFRIAAAAGTGGTKPAFTATISGTLTSPTPIATVAPRKSMPSTSSGTPRSGVELPTLMMILFGLGFATVGIGWKKKII